MIGHLMQDYWQIVEECLVVFHELPRKQAQQLCANFRATIERPRRGISRDAIYHAEPFDVACNLAGNRLDLKEHFTRYEEISAREDAWKKPPRRKTGT